jgi:hypothetical protein
LLERSSFYVRIYKADRPASGKGRREAAAGFPDVQFGTDLWKGNFIFF